MSNKLFYSYDTTKGLSENLQASYDGILTYTGARTLWVHGMPFGNQYVNSANKEYPEGAEVFNDFTCNKAEAEYSHAEGRSTYTYAGNIGEHACGRYNTSAEGQIFSIGIGESDAKRKNAITVKADGSIYVAPIKVGDKDVDPCNGESKTIQQILNEGSSVDEVTYSGLKERMTNKSLVPGKFYKVTDYEATVKDNINFSIISTPKFDILVQAATDKTIFEDAKLMPKGNNSADNLEAYTVKYAVDDSDRFDWYVASSKSLDNSKITVSTAETVYYWDKLTTSINEVTAVKFPDTIDLPIKASVNLRDILVDTDTNETINNGSATYELIASFSKTTTDDYDETPLDGFTASYSLIGISDETSGNVEFDNAVTDDDIDNYDLQQYVKDFVNITAEAIKGYAATVSYLTDSDSCSVEVNLPEEAYSWTAGTSRFDIDSSTISYEYAEDASVNQQIRTSLALRVTNQIGKQQLDEAVVINLNGKTYVHTDDSGVKEFKLLRNIRPTDYAGLSVDTPDENTQVFDAVEYILLSEITAADYSSVDSIKQAILRGTITDNSGNTITGYYKETGGKGIIYHMRDNRGNEAGYDFVHIILYGSAPTFASTCYSNVIRPYYTGGKQTINNVHFNRDVSNTVCIGCHNALGGTLPINESDALYVNNVKIG